MAEDNKYEFTLADDKRPPKTSRLMYCLGGSVLLLSAAVLTAVIAMIYQYFALYAKMKDLSVTCKPPSIVEQYPGYFRTPLEQIEVERRYNQISKYPPATRPLPNCTLDCNPRQKRDTTHSFSPRNELEALAVSASVVGKLSRTKRQEFPNLEGNVGQNPIFHGCCESEKSWTAPTTATNQQGETVSVVQLDEHKQYFLQESCQHSPGCDICRCGQPEPFLYTAIVYKGEDQKNVEENILQFPGCCKCLNIVVGQ